MSINTWRLKTGEQYEGGRGIHVRSRKYQVIIVVLKKIFF